MGSLMRKCNLSEPQFPHLENGYNNTHFSGTQEVGCVPPIKCWLWYLGYSGHYYDEYSVEGLMLKVKLQYFGHLMQSQPMGKRLWCWERLKVGGEGDGRGQDGWMASLTQWTWVWAGSRRWWRTGRPGMLQSMGSQRAGHNLATEQQQLWWSCSQAEQTSSSCLPVLSRTGPSLVALHVPHRRPMSQGRPL